MMGEGQRNRKRVGEQDTGREQEKGAGNRTQKGNGTDRLYEKVMQIKTEIRGKRVAEEDEIGMQSPTEG